VIRLKEEIMDIESRLTRYFKEEVNSEVAGDTLLIESGIIDSMGVQELIGFIERSWEVEFEMDDLTVENFGSIDSIKKVICEKKENT